MAGAVAVHANAALGLGEHGLQWQPMANEPTHIAGPVYLTHDQSADDFDAATVLEVEWLAEVGVALDVLSSRLSEIIGASSEYRTDVRFKYGELLINDSFFAAPGVIPSEFDREPWRRFVDAVSAAAHEHGEIWATDESNLAQPIAHYLAVTSVDDVTRFIRYMEGCDLDHEVDHGHEICSVVATHGWTPETVALWVARCGTCAGQHGHESEWQAPNGDSVRTWIGGDEERKDLVVRLIAANLIAMLDWRHCDDVPFMQASMEDDGVDIFFNPEELADLGLESAAGAIVAEALALSKSRVAELSAAGNRPEHWLAELER